MHKANMMIVTAGALLSAAAPAAARADPDFTGVWIVDGDTSTLRPTDGAAPPLTAWGKAAYAKNRRAFARRDFRGDLTRLQCAAPGPARIMTLPYPIEFFQRPYQLTMLFGWNHHYRLVNLKDVKAAPYPLSIGISNGHWDGDTLVVRTTDMTDNTLLDSSGLPHGDMTVMTERIRLLGPDSLEDVVTISDAKAYRKDWSFRLRYTKTGARGVDEDVCLDRIAAGKPAL